MTTAEMETRKKLVLDTYNATDNVDEALLDILAWHSKNEITKEEATQLKNHLLEHLKE